MRKTDAAEIGFDSGFSGRFDPDFVLIKNLRQIDQRNRASGFLGRRVILCILNFREHLQTFPSRRFSLATIAAALFLAPTPRTTAARCDRSQFPVSLVSLPRWAKPMMAHKAEENRLPKSTGRAEVTVPPVDFPRGLTSARCR